MLLATRLTVAYACVLALARITPSQAQLPCDQSKLSTHPFQPKDVTLGISGTTMTLNAPSSQATSILSATKTIRVAMPDHSIVSTQDHTIAIDAHPCNLVG